jgi:hypothetical protein
VSIASNVAGIAPDAAVPQLSLLLDGEQMALVLARTLGREIADARIAYVSYDPGERIVVHYQVVADDEIHDAVVLADAGLDLAARAAAAESLALVRIVDGRSPARTPLSHDRENDLLVQWPPLDLALPAFAQPVEQLRERIEEAGIEADDAALELVHYKPGRRAVLRFGQHFLKIYASAGQFERSIHNLRAVEPLPIRTPICEAVLPELRIGVQSLVLGLQPIRSKEVAHEAGAVLARLHAARLDGLRAAPASYWIKSAVKSARVLSAVVPAVERRLQRLIAELESRMTDDEVVPCHCDFDARQLLELDGDFALVDFDSMSTSPPAFDLASYIAFAADHGGLSEAYSTLDRLAEGYGQRPENVQWYLAIVLLRRARIPFRRFLDGWPEQIETRVSGAEEALHSS